MPQGVSLFFSLGPVAFLLQYLLPHLADVDFGRDLRDGGEAGRFTELEEDVIIVQVFLRALFPPT